jgi:hypothetical protein
MIPIWVKTYGRATMVRGASAKVNLSRSVLVGK